MTIGDGNNRPPEPTAGPDELGTITAYDTRTGKELGKIVNIAPDEVETRVGVGGLFDRCTAAHPCSGRLMALHDGLTIRPSRTVPALWAIELKNARSYIIQSQRCLFCHRLLAP